MALVISGRLLLPTGANESDFHPLGNPNDSVRSDYALGFIVHLAAGRREDEAGIIRKWRKICFNRSADQRLSREIRLFAAILRKQGLYEESGRTPVNGAWYEATPRPRFGWPWADLVVTSG